MEPKGSWPFSQKPATDPISSQLNTIHTVKTYFFKIRF
jgi:hypothetical protein